jgi:hypothetical protein
MTRWNGQPFILDGGSGGQIEFGGMNSVAVLDGPLLKLIE